MLHSAWIIRMLTKTFRRLQLISLFSIGFLLIAIAIVRLPINWGYATTQFNRNIWGSVEEFAAAFVANVPTLFSLRRRPDLQNKRASQCTERNVRLSEFRQFRPSDEGIWVTSEIELQHKMSGTESELSSPRYWESWETEKRDSRDNHMFVSNQSFLNLLTWSSNLYSNYRL
jgi:hypothetical protein